MLNRSKCATCNGKGTVRESCPTCNGTGRSIDDYCIICRGKGTVLVPCRPCEGRGEIELQTVWRQNEAG